MRRSPGQLQRGFVNLPVQFESELPYFTEAALKVYLAIRLRTVWEESLPITSTGLAMITGLSDEAVRSALKWLEDPASRKPGVARDLPPYIRRAKELEHPHSLRRVQVIYVVGWRHPRDYMKELQKLRRGEAVNQEELEQKSAQELAATAAD